ncbi:MAG: bifunctional 5,10-methylene-tetrahydrofolate dehydrogenase/5,10-methylene-tetrahydrofolate cyclohydrolase [Treponema sp.]|nr:bifunctional 5,10-methylene-tetrahydrofolate dehydrogenase/5,10-methylene-tetrahydrofolate cyclohydrolase [Treponema sp.]
MAATIIDGKAIAEGLYQTLRERVGRLQGEGISPCLAVLLVGEDPASLSYVRAKQRALADLNMEGRDIRLPEETTEEELLRRISSLNEDTSVHGILVQFPLPPHIRTERIVNALEPSKDVDCFHPLNLGKLLRGQEGFLPCTPRGIIFLLSELKIPLKGKNIVILGRSNIVGKPLALLLARREQNATVTICHTGTKDLGFHSRQADILIAAAGSAGLVSADMIKEGAVVIDVGVNRVADLKAKRGYRLKGDVVFAEAAEKASVISPVPGGVGPMTIAMLMQNVVDSAEGIFT